MQELRTSPKSILLAKRGHVDVVVNSVCGCAGAGEPRRRLAMQKLEGIASKPCRGKGIDRRSIGRFLAVPPSSRRLRSSRRRRFIVPRHLIEGRVLAARTGSPAFTSTASRAGDRAGVGIHTTSTRSTASPVVDTVVPRLVGRCDDIDARRDSSDADVHEDGAGADKQDGASSGASRRVEELDRVVGPPPIHLRRPIATSKVDRRGFRGGPRRSASLHLKKLHHGV